ncbi:MAG: Non-ribosomal peptide synthetase [Pedosphaera sp.]|nr:Non-ribosomal peptide synthetase [Pedosphaera sp.]
MNQSEDESGGRGLTYARSAAHSPAGFSADASLSRKAMTGSSPNESPAQPIEVAGKTCLHQLFEAQVARTPNAVAVAFAEEQLTYAELNAQADKWAATLRWLGVGPEVLVGLCVERSPQMIVGILAILKAGGAYVPLDPSYPFERLAFLLSDARPPVLLTQEKLIHLLPPHEARVICLDLLLEPNASKPAAVPITGDNLAYVIYTSGSTGRAKGVMVTHRNVVRLFTATQPWFSFNEHDVWTLFHSFAFDFSVWEIFGALLHGGRLVVVPYAVSRSPEAFRELLSREQVTVLNQTPSAFRLLLQAEQGTSASEGLALRLIIFGGEALELRKLKPWFDRYGDQSPRLVNMYGITETTVHVTYRPLTIADLDQSSVIGGPLPDLQLFLLDEQLQPVPPGVPGELCIGGAGLARGYLNSPEVTAQKFIPNPFSEEPGARLYRSGDLARRLSNEDIEYLGRMDHQVKIRGHRVELGEIETALNAHPTVRNSVVLLREDLPGDPKLTAYLVSRPGQMPGASELQNFLLAKLPAYMVPASFVWLPSLPLTVNGKLDRQALPAPGHHRPDLDQPCIEPRTELERFLADIWCTVLNLDRVGIHDKFFELGGHSLQGAEFIAQVDRKLGEKIFVVALFEAPTIGDFAAYLLQNYSRAVARVFGSPAASTAMPGACSNGKVDGEMLALARSLIQPPGFHPHAQSGWSAQKNKRALFILAPPRSGTSLLRIMLAGHPRIFSASELHLLGFNNLAERKAFFTGKYSLWLDGLLRALMEIKRCDAAEAARQMAEYEYERLPTHRFYSLLQEWLGDKMLAEKTPAYALDVETLQRAETDFDGALYIHLVRHPHAMVSSFEENRLNQVYFTYEHPFSPRQLGELYWLIVNQNTLEFLEQVPAHRQCRIRFEDLVTYPEAIMSHLCHSFGIEFHPDMIQPYKNPERKMLDGIHPQSHSMTDAKFHQYKCIESQVAHRSPAVGADNFLGDLTWELARVFGYESSEPVLESSSAQNGSVPAAASVRADRLSDRRQLRQMHRRKPLDVGRPNE